MYLKAPKGNILSAGYISTEKRKRKRLEKHSGSNSKSHRSAVKGQPSWQQRYGGTMVNHSHASPNNTRQGKWLRNTDSPICLLVHTGRVWAPTRSSTPTVLKTLLKSSLCIFFRVASKTKSKIMVEIKKKKHLNTQLHLANVPNVPV